MPDDPVLTAKLRIGMYWILTRRTVLTELGRMMNDNPTEQDMKRFQDAVRYIAQRRPKITAKEACARIRRMRLGETKRRDRGASLHHDLNTAINQHRRHYPESTWADVQRALDRTAGVVGRKL